MQPPAGYRPKRPRPHTNPFIARANSATVQAEANCEGSTRPESSGAGQNRDTLTGAVPINLIPVQAQYAQATQAGHYADLVDVQAQAAKLRIEDQARVAFLNASPLQPVAPVLYHGRNQQTPEGPQWSETRSSGMEMED